ncbi:N-acetylneuraminate synthase family protein [Candidatus Ozemobacteraceae bacterium]|nr:N-acetylneuraminate synthase family protein [Candidatus Ozemobacteraceae bacterium]
MQITIGHRHIGDSRPCFIIAEAGSNHNRDFDTAIKLIDVAADAGADAVKFQIFAAEKIYSKKTPMASYLKDKKLARDGETLWDIIKRLEIPRGWTNELMAHCRKKNIMFLCTPFDIPAVEELETAGVEAYKIASFEITHLPLIERVARTGKPLILSTGMANLEDIEVALQTFRQAGGRDVALLHCAIAYPPAYENLHLRAMDTLRQAFQMPIGFSDHTMGYITDVAAVARGACIIEKHYTLNRNQDGPDHPFSLEPHELKEMVTAIRQTEAALGSPIKHHTDAEQEMYRIARRSLVAARAIPRGTVLTREMIEVKRPGFGIPTRFLDLVVGRKAVRDIEEDDILTWDMV